mmetsp:Transcript_9539/g.23411  ORF Transcript_9539/g.23411 Transcript_9539/m.23411 type:complete len:213 (-) Transcript_9539:261-899(-)
MSFAQYPASTAAREAPMAADILSQSGCSTVSNLSALPSARPPLTTTLAEPSCGLSSDLVDSLTNSHFPLTKDTSSIAPSVPVSAAISNAVGRTVAMTTSSVDSTVAMALPAYIGRLKAFAETTSVISDIGCTSSSAPTRGKVSRPTSPAAAKMCLKFCVLARSAITGASASAVFAPLARYVFPSFEVFAAASGVVAMNDMSPPTFFAADTTA